MSILVTVVAYGKIKNKKTKRATAKLLVIGLIVKLLKHERVVKLQDMRFVYF